jgi:hypothetical protein
MKATKEAKEALKNRLLAAIRDDEHDSVDFGNVCLVLAAVMLKANGIPESQFVDSAGIFYRHQSLKKDSELR